MSDGRLLLPAAAAWGGVLVGTMTVGAGVPPRAVAGVAVVLAVGGAAILLARLPVGEPRRTGLLVVGLACTVGVLVAGLRADSQQAGPVPEWTAQRATADVFGVVVAEPRQRTFAESAPWQEASILEVPVAMSRVSARARTVQVEGLVLVRLPADVPVPPPGSIVQVTGRLGPLPGPDIVVGLSSRQAPQLLAEPGPVARAATRCGRA